MLSLSRMLNRGVMPIALLLGVLASAGIVLAATSHGTTSGGHTAGSHSYNQTHMWISVGADHGGTISSGARFHDGCAYLVPGTSDLDSDGKLDRCRAANSSPEDFSVDIASTGTSYLKVNYAGYDTGYDPAIKPNTSVTFRAYVSGSGNFSGSNAACKWRIFDIQATWTDVNNVVHYWDTMGKVFLANIDFSSAADLYDYITWTHQQANANGTGTAYYINQAIGSVYNGDDGSDGTICSSGAHSHLGIYSSHNWGVQYELHGYGPDYYYDYHVHGPCATPTAYATPPCGYYSTLTPYSSVSTGTVVGFIGGGYGGYSMW